MFEVLRDTFKNSRMGQAAMAATVAIPLLASFGTAANDTDADEALAGTTSERNSFDDMRAMRHYSEDPNAQGIGVFINLRKGSTLTGEQIGEQLKAGFAGLNPPLPLQYRVNQSQGTATDITFYVKGYDFTMTVTDVANKGLGNILAHHRDVWLLEQDTPNIRPK